MPPAMGVPAARPLPPGDKVCTGGIGTRFTPPRLVRLFSLFTAQSRELGLESKGMVSGTLLGAACCTEKYCNKTVQGGAYRIKPSCSLSIEVSVVPVIPAHAGVSAGRGLLGSRQWGRN